MTDDTHQATVMCYSCPSIIRINTDLEKVYCPFCEEQVGMETLENHENHQ